MVAAPEGDAEAFEEACNVRVRWQGQLTEEVGEPVPEADAEPEPVADAEAEAELQGSVRYAHVTYESARHEVDEPDMMTTAEE